MVQSGPAAALSGTGAGFADTVVPTVFYSLSALRRNPPPLLSLTPLTHSLSPNPSLPPSLTSPFSSLHEILQYASKLPGTRPQSRAPIVRDPEPVFL